MTLLALVEQYFRAEVAWAAGEPGRGQILGPRLFSPFHVQLYGLDDRRVRVSDEGPPAMAAGQRVWRKRSVRNAPPLATLVTISVTFMVD